MGPKRGSAQERRSDRGGDTVGEVVKGGNKPSASQAALAYQGRGDREVDGKPCPEIAGTCIVYEVTWNRDI